MLSETNEADLIKGCVRHDRQAQSLLFHKYSKKMMAVCFRYSRNREDAEEVLNSGFMRVFEKIYLFDGRGSLEGWIRKVIINVAIEKFNRSSKLFKYEDIEKAEIKAFSSYDTYSELNAKELLLLIQKLPPVYQMVFNLYFFEGFKHHEIAEKLGISEGTSKSNLSDARNWLKKRINNLSIEKIAI